MPQGKQEPLQRVSHFQVLIGDREVGFASVGPLTSEADPPGVDPASPRDPGTHRFETVVLRRALTRSTELYDWRRAIIDGKDDRRDVTIRLLAAPGGKVVNAWRLVRAWPCRWSGPDLDALSGDVATEELGLAFDDLVWLDHDPTTPRG